MSRRDALRALALARRDGISFEAAAAALGRDPADLFDDVADALDETSAGLVPTTTDSIQRRMRIITDEGLVTKTIVGSERAKVVWRHWQAAWRMRDTGDESELPNTPVPIAPGVYLTADPDVIDELAFNRDLDVSDIYSND